MSHRFRGVSEKVNNSIIFLFWNLEIVSFFSRESKEKSQFRVIRNGMLIWNKTAQRLWCWIERESIAHNVCVNWGIMMIKTTEQRRVNFSLYMCVSFLWSLRSRVRKIRKKEIQIQIKPWMWRRVGNKVQVGMTRTTLFCACDNRKRINVYTKKTKTWVFKRMECGDEAVVVFLSSSAWFILFDRNHSFQQAVNIPASMWRKRCRYEYIILYVYSIDLDNTAMCMSHIYIEHVQFSSGRILFSFSHTVFEFIIVICA